jgi:hypothetical protein
MGPLPLSHTSDPDELLLLGIAWGSDRERQGGSELVGIFLFYFAVFHRSNFNYLPLVATMILFLEIYFQLTETL